MSKRKFPLMCFVAVIVCTSSFVLAKAVRMDLAPTGSPNDPGASGNAVLNFAKGAEVTQFQVNCRGLTPGCEYGAFVFKSVGIYTLVGTFKVRENGTGNFHAALDGDYSDRSVAVGHPSGWDMVLASQ